MVRKESIRILLVEDDEFYAVLLKDNLAASGFPAVRHARNGVECLMQVFEEDTPDVIIMDHQLGKLNGLDLLKRIIAGMPDVKVMFLSSHNHPDVAVKALKYGAIDYFVKDDSVFDRLILALDQVFDDKARNSSHRWMKALAGHMKLFL